MVDTLIQVPLMVVAGDSLAWERQLSDYPADVWTLTYYFANEIKSFKIIATASATTHVLSATGAVTGAYKAGRYRWHARVTNGPTIATVDDGWFIVKPDPTIGKNDWRSHARKMFDAIESALEGQATKQQLDLINYSLGVVNVSRDRELLMKWRDKYALELRAEEGGRKSDQRNHYIRFVNP